MLSNRYLSSRVSRGALFGVALVVCGIFSGAAYGTNENLLIMEFQTNGYAAFQKSGGNTFSGQISWNPTMDMKSFYLRGNLGVGLLKSTFGGAFLSVNYQALAGMKVYRDFGAEAGGGLQTWVENGGTTAILSTNVVYAVDSRWFNVVNINRLFAGYSLFTLSNNATHEIRLGLGIQI